MRRWLARWADFAAPIERWLLPGECLACQRPVAIEGDELVCAVCRSRWRSIPVPLCPRCGEHLALRLECRVCAAWPPDFGPVRSAARLDPTLRRLLHRLKYHGWRRLAESFAVRMAPLLREFDAADLVPIPLSRARLRRRGYNQAEELAGAVAARSGRRVTANRLRRTRDTPTQTRLGAEERRANLAAAFVATGDAPAILVDDVFTTGATLLSAASALLDSGAPWVAAVTFARADPPLADAGGVIAGADRTPRGHEVER